MIRSTKNSHIYQKLDIPDLLKRVDNQERIETPEGIGRNLFLMYLRGIWVYTKSRPYSITAQIKKKWGFKKISLRILKKSLADVARELDLTEKELLIRIEYSDCNNMLDAIKEREKELKRKNKPIKIKEEKNWRAIAKFAV